MSSFPEDRDSLEEIEALVRAAGTYVRPSEDLRPRVLEAARSEQTQSRWQSGLRLAASLVLILSLWISSIKTSEYLATASFWTSVERAMRSNEWSWGLVDSFTELRRRQAELLRPTASRSQS